MAPNYQLSKIYCIRNSKDENKAVFIGATVRDLDDCMFQHTRNIKIEKLMAMDIYKLMAEVGVEHFSIELISNFPCASQKELNVEKGRIIQQLGMIENGCNSRHAGRERKETIKAYKEAHKEEIQAQRKAYYEANREKIVAYQKAYQEANKEKMAAYKETYRIENKDKIKEQQSEYRKKKREANPQQA